MIEFPCDCCVKKITDFCGEICKGDDEEYITEYTCSHCGEIVFIKRVKL